MGKIKGESETSHKNIIVKTNITQNMENKAVASFVDLKFKLPQYSNYLSLSDCFCFTVNNIFTLPLS